MKTAILSLALVAVLAGCGPDPDTNMQKQRVQSWKPSAAPVADGGRVTVTRIGVFADDLAYNGKRGIYIFRDTLTGAEYLGVSGVGISEVGAHQSGKARLSDER